MTDPKPRRPRPGASPAFVDRFLGFFSGARPLLMRWVRNALPPALGWIATLVDVTWTATVDVERVLSGPGRGAEKMARVKSAVVAALDTLDDLPGWEDLTEAARDGLVESVAELAVFSARWSKAGRAPGAEARDKAAAAVGTLVRTIIDLVAPLVESPAPPQPVAAPAPAIRADVGQDLRARPPKPEPTVVSVGA